MKMRMKMRDQDYYGGDEEYYEHCNCDHCRSRSLMIQLLVSVPSMPIVTNAIEHVVKSLDRFHDV